MVDKDKEAKHSNETTAAELPLTHPDKWEEVGSKLPPIFDDIDPSRRGSTCYSQFNKLWQILKLMKLDHRNPRRANEKPDRIMTNELCWKITEYLDGRLRNAQGNQVAMSNDDQLSCTAARQVASPDHGRPLLDGHGKQICATDDKEPCTVHFKLPESQEVVIHREDPREDRRCQKLCKKEVAEMKFYKVPRSGMYMWSEDARLQVIQGVRMMENNRSQSGQIKSWRELAASLPKKLFWDIDLDRLANITKKQFSEMRRRYRIMMDYKNSGDVGPIKFKTLSKRVLQEMTRYEEGCLQRTFRAPRQAVRKLCDRNENILWVTKTPSLALHAECSGAHGTVLVEILSRSGMGIQNDSSRTDFAEFDMPGRHENSIVPNDGASYEERESADRQKAAVSSSSEEYKDSESSYSKVLESEYRYDNAWEAQDVTKRESLNVDSCCDYRQSEYYLDSQCRQTVSSHAPSAAESLYSEPHHKIDSERDVIEELCLRRPRGCSLAISISSADSDPESDYAKDGADQEGSARGYSQPFCRSSSEESSEGNELENEEFDGSKIREFRRIKPLSANKSDSHSDEDPENGTESSEYLYGSLHGNIDQGEDDLMSHGDAHALPYNLQLRSYSKYESGDFGQSESIHESLNGERSKSGPESSMWKTSSPAYCQCHGETARRRRMTSQSSHPQRDFHRARPLIQEGAKKRGAFMHGETISSNPDKTMDSSGPERNQSSEGPPVLKKMLREVDTEFFKLNRWVQHELLPLERERFKNIISSVSIPNSLLNNGVGSDGVSDEDVSSCRQNRIRRVLKAELRHVRLQLLEEMDKSSQVVMQEILQSLKM